MTATRMPKTTTHWRAFSRTSFTKGVSTVSVVFAWAMSELEIDERPAAGGAEAEIQDHGNRHADPDEAGLQDAAKMRLVEKFVEPDHEHQRQHQRGNLRVVPGRREDAADDEQRIIQRIGPEKNPREANEDEHGELL